MRATTLTGAVRPYHSRTPAAVRGGAPCFTEHNALILRDLLALFDAEVADFNAEGVTADEPQVQLIR
jgi:hypothetical protein